MIDIDTHRPVDVLADRRADTFADWLGEDPGAEVICRDRGGGYVEAAERGAPSVVHVAKRWHLHGRGHPPTPGERRTKPDKTELAADLRFPGQRLIPLVR
ncbi:MAG: hypothetical protein ACRDTG_28725 [Pseudonocardiaceae bacterium]